MKPGKNDPCSCGSGKKFKNCCAHKVAVGFSTPSPSDLNQLIALHNAKCFPELEINSSALVNRYPNVGLAWKLLGIAQRRQGKNALDAFLKTVALMPADAEAHANLGVIQNELGAFNKAITYFKKSLSIKPNSAATLNNLGTALRFSGKLDEALTVYRRALQTDSNSAHIHFNLGTTLKELGQPDKALISYRQVIALKPDSAEAYCNLCSILHKLGQFNAAVESARQAIKLNPSMAGAHSNLGYVLQEVGQHDAAMESFQQSIAANPEYAKVHGNIANLYHKLGQIDKSIASFQRFLEMQPEISTYSDLLFLLNYSHRYTPSESLSEARKFGQTASAKVSSRFTTWQSKQVPKRLRIGLVSGDLRDHPVGYFLENLLTHLNSTRIELIAYTTQTKEDEVTQRIQTSFSAWKSLVGKNDEDAARLIHDDGIHILIDLAGHTAYTRLPVFAWKPAPIQVAWLGYFATTGLTEMDYLIADHVGVPEENRTHFTEQLWYLPETRLCFSPPDTELPVTTLPAIHNEYITFGCFQNLSKVSEVVLSTWADALNAVPDSHLRWQCKQFVDAPVAERVRQRFQELGISPDRISLRGGTSRETYLSAHSEVDMILDTFPYPGGTTTCEALWMGVPTLTLAGDTLLSRQGASMLTAAGLPDWIADSRENFVTKAISLSGDVAGLADLRATLRNQVRVSPLFDAPRFAHNLENALWGMWQARDE